MDSFFMNGDHWRIRRVHPQSDSLIDRTGRRTVATTDPGALCVCLSNELYGDALVTVLLHELGHCALWSYGLLDELHAMVLPGRWVEMEEWLCNFMAGYGLAIFGIAYGSLGYDAWRVVPREMDRLLCA